ncbi:nitrilase-related carbon-nitrogen hydrolase [Thalassospira marina]|uniref:Nitrilase n=1 Tax=Thalassospira marina TaxID=2048283 RepID=A0A2N3KYN7_9PROT|nr:nitrilase-related carbon-nitrogen hydrolase [Thalassospira marina]PKR55643.1 nitrilase [Thalassospira marina]
MTRLLTDTVNIALWATNLGVAISSIDDWIAHIDRKMKKARADGADIFVMPEYASEQWMAFKPQGLRPQDEISWMAEMAPTVIDGASNLATRHDMMLVAGSMPWHIGDDPRRGQTNRALAFLPDGKIIMQDKLSLTPGEQEPDNWNLTPGKKLSIIEWRGLRIAILICLDIEMPALSCLLARQNIDLVLVPSMTSKPSGYHRVFGCAKARAVELMCTIAACGTTGAAINTTQNPTNYSGCAVYIPCEAELGHTGIFAMTTPDGGDDGDGPVLLAHDVPIGTIRRLRAGGAEVWPGNWSAREIEVTQA